MLWAKVRAEPLEQRNMSDIPLLVLLVSTLCLDRLGCWDASERRHIVDSGVFVGVG
jgi:hypothetical protein